MNKTTIDDILSKFSSAEQSINEKIDCHKKVIADCESSKKILTDTYIRIIEELFHIKSGDNVLIEYKHSETRKVQKVEAFYNYITYNGSGIFKFHLNKINKDGSMSKLPVNKSQCPCFDEIIDIKKLAEEKELDSKAVETVNELVDNQKPLEPEFSKVVDENFWNLV